MISSVLNVYISIMVNGISGKKKKGFSLFFNLSTIFHFLPLFFVGSAMPGSFLFKRKENNAFTTWVDDDDDGMDGKGLSTIHLFLQPPDTMAKETTNS